MKSRVAIVMPGAVLRIAHEFQTRAEDDVAGHLELFIRQRRSHRVLAAGVRS